MSLKTAAGAKAWFDSNKGRDFDGVLEEYAAETEFWYEFEDSVHWFTLEDGVLIVSRMNGVEVWEGRRL